MFLAGAFYSWVALFLSYIVFKQYSGLLMVFFISVSIIPLLYTAIKKEEEIDLELETESEILKEHGKFLIFLLHLFLGILTSLTIAYILLPNSIVQIIFSIQADAILDVNNKVSGNITSIGLFQGIFINNLKVLFFCLIFSFIYGVGAIFILTWNASVVAVAIGNMIKSKLAIISQSLGSITLSSYFGVATFSVFRYMTHGILEILAYFVAGLAGSIISVAVIKHNLQNEKVIRDALDLVFISLAILFFAALVEVFITPIFFPTLIN